MKRHIQEYMLAMIKCWKKKKWFTFKHLRCVHFFFGKQNVCGRSFAFKLIIGCANDKVNSIDYLIWLKL